MIPLNNANRICRIANIKLPDNTPIVHQGKEIGKVIRASEEGFSECEINSDIIASWIDGEQVSFSLEVLR